MKIRRFKRNLQTFAENIRKFAANFQKICPKKPGTLNRYGGADIKVVAFKGNPYESPTDIECRERNDAGNLIDENGEENENCKEPLAAAALSIDLGKKVSNLEEPIVFTLPLSNSSLLRC